MKVKEVMVLLSGEEATYESVVVVRVQAGGGGEGGGEGEESDRVQVSPSSISDTHLHNWEHLALGKSH